MVYAPRHSSKVEAEETLTVAKPSDIPLLWVRIYKASPSNLLKPLGYEFFGLRVALCAQQEAQYHLLGLICTPPSGALFSSQREHCLN